MGSFPYSQAEQRPLNQEELAIILFLVSATCPERLKEVESLQVHARCGCGKCPTIMFHAEPEKKEKGIILADFQGGDSKSGLVGIMLWEREGELAELEAWSIDGHDLVSWPALETFRPIEVTID